MNKFLALSGLASVGAVASFGAPITVDLTDATTSVTNAGTAMIGLAVVILGIAIVYSFLKKRG